MLTGWVDARIVLCMSFTQVSFALIWSVASAAVALFIEPDRPSRPPEKYEPVASTRELERFPYQRYFTTDGLGRQITFYVSKPSVGGDGATKPLVVCVQGSGSQSAFLEVETPSGKVIASGGPEAAVMKLARDRVRVLVVEKPGVEFLVQPSRPGSAEESSPEFRQEHTLERWVEAVNAATNAAMTLPGIDTGRIMALGHSEGGQVVCHLAGTNPAITHVASLAGGGPTQLFDLVDLARTGAMGAPGDTGEARAAWILDGYQRVLRSPDSAEDLWLGHPHRRWNTFLRTSPIEGVLKSRARVFIGQGSADSASSPRGADVMHAELLARGRDVTYKRVEGADHAFMAEGEPQGQGWIDMHRAALEWFLGETLGEGQSSANASVPASTSNRP